jgi:hypothetical protein
MNNIKFQASSDAYKLRDADLTTQEIKVIAQENANKKYPSWTKLERGLYRHTFIKKVREHQYRAWIDELNSDFQGRI